MSSETIGFRNATMGEALESPTLDHGMEERVQRWSRILNDDSQFIFYIAEISPGKVIGWCRGGKAMDVHSIVGGEKCDCEIQHLFVLPEYQHRGIGRQLWELLWNDIVRRFHPKNMVVWSVEREGAHKFYTLMGGVERERKAENDYV